jgi:uncharacterized protein
MTGGAIDIAPEHRRIVLSILRQHLPAATLVWVFGSRATGRARRYSDLDLAIDAGRRLTVDEMAILREGFDDSDLPYRVDVVGWQATDDRFRRIIGADRRPLCKPRTADADPPRQ